MEYIKQKRFITHILFFGFIALLVYVTLEYVLRWVSPFLFAFIFAYSLRRPALFISKSTHIPYKPIALLFVLLFYCTIGVLIALAGVKTLSIIADFVSGLPPLYTDEIVPYLSSFFGEIEDAVSRMDPTLIPVLNDLFTQAIQSIGEMVSNFSVKIVALISGYASSLPAFFIRILIMVISTFFIAADYDVLTGFVSRQFTGKSLLLMREIKRYVVGTLFVCIRAYALIMSVTFIELSIGFNIIGISKPFLVALFIALFDILPVLGTGGIMVPWALISVLQGNYTFALSIFVIYVFVTIVRNIIEPKIVGSQIGLHPVVTLISLFVGAQLFGVIGLFGFPITLSLLRHLNETGAIKLFK
ncbi:sporulation integral membrane protein YtvI [Bacillota bacterium]